MSRMIVVLAGALVGTAGLLGNGIVEVQLIAHVPGK
jgi:hypothetical protein